MLRGARRGLVLLATGTIMAGTASGALAQTPPGAAVQPVVPDNGAELRGYLTTLANNPQSLDALIGAGRAALRMGDADAALTFFGRADEVSPRNARVKAGMASTLVQLGQPEAALSLFAESLALGAPEVEILGDRGLAYDMSGDPRRAQRDYVTALRRRDDAELRRRLALSLAISGHREAALRTIDAQLRRNDRAAWRTQAFILALTGDAAGAAQTAQSQMPGAGQQMAPFFARLHALSPGQKALAVHLGRFPSNGRAQAQGGPVDTSPDPTALAFAGIATRTPVQVASTTRARTQNEDRRESSNSRRRERPDPSDPFGLRDRGTRRQEAPASSQADRRVAPPVERRTDVAEINTRWAGSPYEAQGGATSPPPAPVQASPSLPQPSAPVVQPPRVASPSSTSATIEPSASPPPAPSIVPVQIAASAPEQAASAPASGLASAPASSGILSAPSAPSVDIASAGDEAAEPPSLAEIAALVRALPEEPPAQAQAPAPSASRSALPARSETTPAATRPTETRTAAARTSERTTRPQPPANPSRHWVQIAGGIDRASLPREFARLRAKAPEQLGRRTAYASPLRTTSRLLVGPFATTREAQEFVNQLARHDIQAFAWTSAAGQEIERLARR